MKIHGDKVIIKETDRGDLEDIQQLWNNGEVMASVGYPDGLGQTFAEMGVWFKNIQECQQAKHYVIFTVDEKFCGELFYRKNLKYNRAGLDIKLLPEAQGQGLATEALQLIIDYIFKNEDKIEAVWTEPSEENRAARKLYARAGLEAKERPADLKPGRPYWELSREDWQALEVHS